MKTIVVAEGQVLPLCSACRDPRSLWFLVERSPRVESIASARSADTEAAGEQRSGIGA